MLVRDWMLDAAAEITADRSRMTIYDVHAVIKKHCPLKADTAYAPVEEWLTPTEAARRMQVSRRTIYNWMQGKRIVVQQTSGGTRRILASSLWKPR